MIFKKTYYSISEVSKMLNIKEHTIRFWDSKLPDLSKRENKGKTRFFNLKQIEKLSKLNNILKNNDSITLAYENLSKNNYKSRPIDLADSSKKMNNSNSNQLKVNKIKDISNNLKNLINLKKY